MRTYLLLSLVSAFPSIAWAAEPLSADLKEKGAVVGATVGAAVAGYHLSDQAFGVSDEMTKQRERVQRLLSQKNQIRLARQTSTAELEAYLRRVPSLAKKGSEIVDKQEALNRALAVEKSLPAQASAKEREMAQSAVKYARKRLEAAESFRVNLERAHTNTWRSTQKELGSEVEQELVKEAKLLKSLKGVNWLSRIMGGVIGGAAGTLVYEKQNPEMSARIHSGSYGTKRAVPVSGGENSAANGRATLDASVAD